MAKFNTPEDKIKQEIRTSYNKEYYKQAKKSRPWTKKLGHGLMLTLAVGAVATAIGGGVIAYFTLEVAASIAGAASVSLLVIHNRAKKAITRTAKNNIEQDISNGTLLDRFETEVLDKKRSVLQSLRDLKDSFTPAASIAKADAAATLVIAPVAAPVEAPVAAAKTENTVAFIPKA